MDLVHPIAFAPEAMGLSCIPAALLQNKNNNALAIIMGRAPGHDLENGGGLPNGGTLPKRLAAAYQMAYSVQRLHEKGIIVGDLALDNIIIDPQNWALYLIDIDGAGFGSYGLLNNNGSKGEVEPPEHKAKSPYTLEMDLWGLAVLSHFILTNEMPNHMLSSQAKRNPNISEWPPKNEPKGQTHLKTLKLLGDKILDSFLKVFNEARKNPTKRITAKE